MDQENFLRVFRYSTEFYLERLHLIMLFSIPFIFAFLIPVFVAAPTYLALGGVFLRTGSIPDLSILDLLVAIAGYAISMFLIVDTIININIIIRSKRTMTEIKNEIVTSIAKHATKVFVIYTAIVVVLFILQVVLYESPLQSIIYPLCVLGLSFFTFFAAPAVVIDNYDSITAIRRSVDMAFKKPMMIFAWTIICLFVLTVLVVFFDFLLPYPYAGFMVLIFNSLFLLPFLVVLQTQMYMEKYPLAR